MNSLVTHKRSIRISTFPNAARKFGETVRKAEDSLLDETGCALSRELTTLLPYWDKDKPSQCQCRCPCSRA